tara:strand:+ start:84 stop:1388 length:1305 start_codon:yes stop_codon:yes gene_type:complete
MIAVTPFPQAAPLKVAVLVALFRRPDAGGHVKCWERFATAAAAFPDPIDLTVHFLGDAEGCEDLAANVRLKTWRPRFCTARLPFLGPTPGDTDLAPSHPALTRDLGSADVIHTTDAFFSFTGSARRAAAARGRPLVTSVHTDTPGYARALAVRETERLLARLPQARPLIRRLALPDRLYDVLARRLARHQAEAVFTLVSSADQRRQAEAAVAPDLVRPLERGIDFATFSPAARDRAFLEQAYGAPRDRFLIAYVGRLDCCKNVSLLVQAFDHDGLAAMNAHLLFAGDGPERAALARHFGPRASLPGALPQIDAARVLASADLFVFPSQLETFANVVRECLASGTGALVSNRGGGAGDVDAGVTGRYLPPDDPAAWRDAARAAAADPDRTAAWGTAAAAVARRRFPSWADVLARDLIPVWQEAAAGGAGIIRRAA